MQPQEVNTGVYSRLNEDLKDEWFWATAELFRASEKKTYLEEIELPENPRVPEWDAVEGLGLYALARNGNATKLHQLAREKLIVMANRMVQ